MGRAVPIDLPGPEGLAELAEEVQQARAGSDDPFDLVVEVPPGTDVHAWEAAGATWVLTSIEPQPPEPDERAPSDDAQLIGAVLPNSPGIDTPLRSLTSANALASRARAAVAPRRDEEAGLHAVGLLVQST